MNPDFFRQMQEMQKKAAELQKTLAATEVEGVSGGGLVRAVLNGLGEVKSVAIDPTLLKPEEQAVVQDLVVAACNDAKTKLEARRAQDAQFFTDILKGLGMGGN
jgi:DNA-binding YbaB/EbfC family protein